MSEKDPLAIISIQPATEHPGDLVPRTPAAAGGRTDPVSDPQPLRPTEPDAADCCGEGCVRCVYDRYDDAVERYQGALAAWQTRHPEP